MESGRGCIGVLYKISEVRELKRHSKTRHDTAIHSGATQMQAKGVVGKREE